MKRIFLLLISVTMLLSSLIALSSCGDDDDAPPKNAVHLSTKEDLLKLSDGGDFILDNDIDCEGLSLKAIQNFKGSIDGQGYKIHNVRFISDNNCFGLIGSIAEADGYDQDIVIKNLALTDFTIDTNLASADGTLYAGGLIALNWHPSNSLFRSVIIENCYVAGDIKIDINSNNISVGGIIGMNTRDTIIKNCVSDVNIDCELNEATFKGCTVNAGGVAGQLYQYLGYYSELENVVFTGSVDVDTVMSVSLTAKLRVGGILGYSDGYSEISSCLSVPDHINYSSFFDRNVNVGMLVGVPSDSKISYSYWCAVDDEAGVMAPLSQLIKASLHSGPVNSVGTGVKLYKYDMITADFMKGDYSFDDLDGNRKDSFLSFDPEVWSFGGLNSNGGLNLPYPKVLKSVNQ